ncbi:MAG: YraN family protein [Eubacteriales bacterium]
MKYINVNKLGVTGLFGENVAADYMESLGYDIIGRNVIVGGKEIDIIAEDLKYIVFVEVKTRKNFVGRSRYGTPAKSVNKEKQQRIISAAKIYIKENNPRRLARFDVIEVYVDYTPKGLKTARVNHIPRAFGTW